LCRWRFWTDSLNEFASHLLELGCCFMINSSLFRLLCDIVEDKGIMLKSYLSIFICRWGMFLLRNILVREKFCFAHVFFNFLPRIMWKPFTLCNYFCLSKFSSGRLPYRYKRIKCIVVF
jgi:hypothetical protein